ncbi:MAG: carboxypeptidase regulatory-like domain-containing protein [Aquabacterium sp.]|nr:MAG: carboxypeptidase regulatory-like domain-containing protein [Aquabacterium sp.]
MPIPVIKSDEEVAASALTHRLRDETLPRDNRKEQHMATQEQTRIIEEIHRRVTLQGRVRLKDGTPAEGALVVVRPDGGKGDALLTVVDERAGLLRSTHSRADGSFHFLDLPPGLYKLTASRKRVDADRAIELQVEQRVKVEAVQLEPAGKRRLPVFSNIVLDVAAAA